MTPSALLRRVLLYGSAVAGALALVGAAIALLVGGPPEVLGVIVGAGMALVFTSLTALSILLAVRVTRMDMLNPLFFGIVLGVMVVKFILFVVLANLLSSVESIDPLALYLTVILAVLGTLITDSIAFMRSRVPFIDDRPVVEAAEGGPQPR